MSDLPPVPVMGPCTGNLTNTEWVAIFQYVNKPKKRMYLKIAKGETQEAMGSVLMWSKPLASLFAMHLTPFLLVGSHIGKKNQLENTEGNESRIK